MNPVMSLLTVALISSGLLTQTQSSVTIGHFNFRETIQHLSAKAPHLNRQVLALALRAYQRVAQTGQVKNPKLTVIDYSLPSYKARMWVFDLKRQRLLYYTYVAHGAGSGLDIPHRFSNVHESHASSLGTYVTRDIYQGHHGPSLNLKGLEKGFNDKAYERRVVIHGAPYVNPSFIKQVGRAGRSWGCPAIAVAIVKPLIHAIKNGSVVFAFYPDRYYLKKSAYITA